MSFDPPPPPPPSYPSYQTPSYGGTPPPNYLVWAILVTLFCCLPFGVVSIVQSANVNSRWNAGDHAGARDASDKARKFAIIGAAVGVGVTLLYVVVVLLAAAAPTTG